MRRTLSKAVGAGAAAIAAALALAGVASAAPAAPDLVLTGTMTGADHETYREVPFQVPAGVTAVTVEFAYTGKEQRSVIDLGLRDPERFRGWSGGNKARFTVSESYATPSYLPGPLPAGAWKLILGVPNLRKDGRADYTARVYFERGTFQGFAPAPLRSGPAWYRGDLHMHTAHSDGSCTSQKGARIPCPVFRTLEAAVARGLDFVAVTDHNAASHHQDLVELQPYFDNLLLIPGREITTFRGHANVFGVTAPLDFQLGSPRAPTLSKILDEVEAHGGLISINHPASPSGENCMGCGWTAETDYARIPAMEAINGGSPAGVLFWEARLNAGFHVTAVGGSDNHNPEIAPGMPSAVATPTTVVFADDPSQPAILAAIRAGHVFVDVQGAKGRLLEVTASSGASKAMMGDSLSAPAGGKVEVKVHAVGAAGAKLAVAGLLGTKVSGLEAPLSADETRTLSFAADGKRGWFRVDVKAADGTLLLLGNPIYLAGAR